MRKRRLKRKMKKELKKGYTALPKVEKEETPR